MIPFPKTGFCWIIGKDERGLTVLLPHYNSGLGSRDLIPCVAACQVDWLIDRHSYRQAACQPRWLATLEGETVCEKLLPCSAPRARTGTTQPPRTRRRPQAVSVSYTHLTLPTIYSV